MPRRIMFCTPLSVAYFPASVRHPCVRDYMFPRYLQYLSIDFRQIFVIGASWDKDELTRFWAQKVKGQGHIKAADASSTERCCRAILSSLLIWTELPNANNAIIYRM